MSIHSSLRSKGSLGAIRNVLKRHERVRHMMTQGTWTDGQSVLGLPKIKQLKLKSRKAAPKEKEEAAAGTTPGAAPAAGAPS
jgi:small basic protein (TIGR04137 family)